MGKCLIIGSTVCDVMIYVDKLPHREGDVHVHQQKLSLGGCAFNVAQVLHELGSDYQFISPVGTGLYGDFVAGELARLNMPVTYAVPEENGACYCFVEADGERTFVSYHGAEYHLDASWLTAVAQESFDYIYVCGLEIEEKTGPDLVEGLPFLKGQLVFAPGPRGHVIDSRLLEKIYALSPILHLNQEEVCQLAGISDRTLAAERLYQLTNRPLIVTKGEQGASLYDGSWQDILSQSAPVVDTIGAGDSHIGAVLAALARGKSMPEAIQFANQLAAQVVGVQGSRLSQETYQALKMKL